MSNGDDEFDDTEMVSGFNHTQRAAGFQYSGRSESAPDLENPTDRLSIPVDDDGFSATARAPGSIVRAAGDMLQFRNNTHEEDSDGLDEASDAFSQTSVAPITADDIDAIAIGSAIDGRFTITGVLGEGGMGKVYQAIQTSINREVAIKVVRPEFAKDPELRARFEREARLISSFNHPNIVRLVDYGESAGRLYLAMEFVNGRPISQLFGKKQILPRYALEMARQVASALIEAHAKGVVHRDLKPDNILASRLADGTVQYKVLDFGVARTNSSNLTQMGTVCGTPQYMAPEQARGQTVTPAADLYAVGVLLFEMLCGQLPFVEASVVKLMIRHVQDPPPRVRQLAPHVPKDIDNLVQALLEKMPTDRPGGSDILCAKIDKIMSDHGWTDVVRLPAGPLQDTTVSWEVDPIEEGRKQAALQQERQHKEAEAEDLKRKLETERSQNLAAKAADIKSDYDPVEEARRSSMSNTVDEDSHWLAGGVGISMNDKEVAPEPEEPSGLAALDFSNLELDRPVSEPATPAPAPVITAPPSIMPPTPYSEPTLTAERPAPRPANAAPVYSPRPAPVVKSSVNMMLGVFLGVLMLFAVIAAFFVLVKPRLGGSTGIVMTAQGDAKVAFEALAAGGWELGQIVPSEFGSVKLESGKVTRDGVTLSVSVYDCPTKDDIRNVFRTTVLPSIAYYKSSTVVRIEPVGEAPRADIEQAIGFVSKAIPGGELSNTNLR
jgi:serine/threonine protein kinase